MNTKKNIKNEIRRLKSEINNLRVLVNVLIEARKIAVAEFWISEINKLKQKISLLINANLKGV